MYSFYVDTNKCSIYNKHIATENRASYIGGIIVEETRESEYHAMTNEEYRERLNHISSQIVRNDVLGYYYTYIVEKERVRRGVCGKNKKNGA